MKNLQDWLKELISDERWHEQAGKNHKPETFQKVAEQVYTLGISDRDNFEIVPLREHRNHVVNKLNKILPDRPKPKSWHEIALEKKIKEDVKEEWVPVSPEERQRRLADFKKLVDSMPIINNFPRMSYKEEAENNGWKPAKAAPYPVTSVDEAYIKMRHFEYIKRNYEPRTGAKLPEFIEEEEFNKLYDADLL